MLDICEMQGHAADLPKTLFPLSHWLSESAHYHHESDFHEDQHCMGVSVRYAGQICHVTLTSAPSGRAASSKAATAGPVRLL